MELNGIIGRTCREVFDLIITDRVHSTKREVIVSLCLSVHTCGGHPGQGGACPGYPPARSGQGVPQSGGTCGGYPQPGQNRGYPSQKAPAWGTPPARSEVRTGVPQPGGTHPGYPPARSGWGVPQPGGICLGYLLPGQDQGLPQPGGTCVGYPPPGQDGGYPSREVPAWGTPPPPGQDRGYPSQGAAARGTFYVKIRVNKFPQFFEIHHLSSKTNTHAQQSFV